MRNNIDNIDLDVITKRKAKKQGCIARQGKNKGGKSKGRISKNKAGFKVRRK